MYCFIRPIFTALLLFTVKFAIVKEKIRSFALSGAQDLCDLVHTADQSEISCTHRLEVSSPCVHASPSRARPFSIAAKHHKLISKL